MEVNRWDSWSLHCLLLVRSFLLVAQGEGIYLAEKTKVVWSEAETLFHALVGRGPLRSGKRLEKKWNSYDVTLPTLQEQLSCWIVNGSFSEESKAFAYVAHCLESLKGQTLPNRWAKWCVQYNLGAGPFVFLYRVIHQFHYLLPFETLVKVPYTGACVDIVQRNAMTGKGLGPPDGLWSGTRPTSETTTLWADTLLTLWQCPAAEVPTVHGEWLGKGMLPPLPALQELQAILSTGPSTACPPVGRRLSLAPLHARIGDKTMLTLNTQDTHIPAALPALQPDVGAGRLSAAWRTADMRFHVPTLSPFAVHPLLLLASAAEKGNHGHTAHGLDPADRSLLLHSSPSSSSSFSYEYAVSGDHVSGDVVSRDSNADAGSPEPTCEGRATVEEMYPDSDAKALEANEPASDTGAEAEAGSEAEVGAEVEAEWKRQLMESSSSLCFTWSSQTVTFQRVALSVLFTAVLSCIIEALTKFRSLGRGNKRKKDESLNSRPNIEQSCSIIEPDNVMSTLACWYCGQYPPIVLSRRTNLMKDQDTYKFDRELRVEVVCTTCYLNGRSAVDPAPFQVSYRKDLQDVLKEVEQRYSSPDTTLSSEIDLLAEECRGTYSVAEGVDSYDANDKNFRHGDQPLVLRTDHQRREEGREEGRKWLVRNFSDDDVSIRKKVGRRSERISTTDENGGATWYEEQTRTPGSLSLVLSCLSAGTVTIGAQYQLADCALDTHERDVFVAQVKSTGPTGERFVKADLLSSPSAYQNLFPAVHHMAYAATGLVGNQSVILLAAWVFVLSLAASVRKLPAHLSDQARRKAVSELIWNTAWFKTIIGTATGVHVDETEAANVMIACLCFDALTEAAKRALAYAPLALWCLFRRADMLGVQKYLAKKGHSLFVASYLFTGDDFAKLADLDIFPHWVFQRVGDVVFISGMVAHSVYNIISCLKYAGDSVSANHLAVTATKIRIQALVEDPESFGNRVPHMTYTVATGNILPPGKKQGAFLVDPVLLSLYNLKSLEEE